MFAKLIEELKKWSDDDQIAEFWWRDDDAQKPSVQLERLLEISDKHQVAVSLATIPDGVQDSLVEELSGHHQVNILQHGFSHQNHAPVTERKMELGWHRPAEEVMEQIQTGLIDLQDLFGKQLLPVMVPPWNRIDLCVVKKLRKAGLHGISTLGPRKHKTWVEGLRQTNVHVDIINWKHGRSFAGEISCIGQIITHLEAKREGWADPEEPTDIMTHHLIHDSGCWGFLNELFGFLVSQSETCLTSAKKIF